MKWFCSGTDGFTALDESVILRQEVWSLATDSNTVPCSALNYIFTSGEEPHLFFSFLLNSVRPSVRPFPPLPRPRSPCQSELICITAEHRRERRGDTADRATYMEMYEPEVRSEL
ncbi:hypothetical protein F2P81_013266 [Scophthalmus maximus]|uniref:Uncharacterized protein n=1 Tax=Scophthalmus maximus TaxID=52904 RepID=A0A6A4STS6_SCOMX|nr:hypothetical protein F2P81_013266 [Scophthalmus maximus]